MKRCSKCGHEKAPTPANFGRCATTRDRLRPECKECRADYQANYAKTNAASLKAYFRTYYRSNASTIKTRSRDRELANPEAARQRKRADYEANSETFKERERKRYADNRAQRQAKQRDYHRNNPSAARVAGNRRRTRLAAQPSDFKLRNWRAALNYFNGCCAACLTRAALVMDHWRAVSRGGSTTTDNIVPLCAPCNGTKHNRQPAEWLRSRFGVDAAIIGERITAYFAWVKRGQENESV